MSYDINKRENIMIESWTGMPANAVMYIVVSRCIASNDPRLCVAHIELKVQDGRGAALQLLCNSFHQQAVMLLLKLQGRHVKGMRSVRIHR